MHYVYALVSNDSKRIYVGMTKNLENRVKEHNSYKTKSTKHYGPWVLFYSEKLDDRLTAREREKSLKSGYGKEYLKSILRDKHTCARSSTG